MRRSKSFTLGVLTVEYTWNPYSNTLYFQVYFSLPGWTLVAFSTTLQRKEPPECTESQRLVKSL